MGNSERLPGRHLHRRSDQVPKALRRLHEDVDRGAAIDAGKDSDLLLEGGREPVLDDLHMAVREKAVRSWAKSVDVLLYVGGAVCKYVKQNRRREASSISACRRAIG